MPAVTSTYYTFALVVLSGVIFAFASVHSLPKEKSSSTTKKPPAYVECVNSDECAFDSCCVLGMGRYSIPECRKKQQLQEICRPLSREAVNTTVSYADGEVVSLHNIHMIMCPCDRGLVCDKTLGKCVESDSGSNHNHVHEMGFVADD